MNKLNVVPRPNKAALNIRESKLANEYATNGGNLKAAAVVSGYSPASASTMMARPHMLQAVAKARERMIKGPMAGLALRTIKDAIADESCAWGVRVSAAKFALDLAGIAAPAPGTSKPQDLGSMTISELERFVSEADARSQAVQLIETTSKTVETKQPTEGEAGQSDSLEL